MMEALATAHTPCVFASDCHRLTSAGIAYMIDEYEPGHWSLSVPSCDWRVAMALCEA